MMKQISYERDNKGIKSYCKNVFWRNWKQNWCRFILKMQFNLFICKQINPITQNSSSKKPTTHTKAKKLKCCMLCQPYFLMKINSFSLTKLFIT